MNKNSISVVAIYSLVVAVFSGLASSFIDGEFIWTSFLKTTAITWVLATILGYILYLLVYPKNVQPSTPNFKPSTQYFYNDYVNGFCRVEKIMFGYDGSVTSEFNFLDKEGKTILWRRYNRDDWAIDRYKKPWSEQLPKNDRLIVNGTTYVHWYDCITDHIL